MAHSSFSAPDPGNGAAENGDARTGGAGQRNSGAAQGAWRSRCRRHVASSPPPGSRRPTAGDQLPARPSQRHEGSVGTAGTSPQQRTRLHPVPRHSAGIRRGAGRRLARIRGICEREKADARFISRAWPPAQGDAGAIWRSAFPPVLSSSPGCRIPMPLAELWAWRRIFPGGHRLSGSSP